VDVSTGKWTAVDFGIGGGVDSYFEYLVKGGIMFNIPGTNTTLYSLGLICLK
jgi:mannosidase alpha-like ER degradation enhancer 2